MIRKLLTTHALIVTMLLGLLPTFSIAAWADDVTEWTSTNSLPQQGNYKLMNDVTLPTGNSVVVTIGSGMSLTIDLNGKTINAPKDRVNIQNTLFKLEGGSLTIKDSQGGGVITRPDWTDDGIVWNTKGGNFYMEGGTITGIETKASIVTCFDESTFTMTGGSIVGNTLADRTDNYAVSITSGTFRISGNSTITNNNGAVDSSKRNVYLSNDMPIAVIGELLNSTPIGVTMQTPGVFTNSENIALNDASKFVSDNENYIVRKTAEGQLKLGVPSVAAVTADGTTTEYETLTDALAAWVDGSTLKLLKDVGTESTISVSDGTRTLDLNGYTIDGNQNGSVITISGGTLVLDDSSEDKTGVITGGNSTGNGGGVAVNGGTFRMLGGIIEHNTAKNGAGVAVMNGATFEMLGGKVQYNESVENTGGVLLNNGANFTMSGGEIQYNVGPRYGGIGSANAIVKFSGTPVVKNNTLKDGTPCDVRNTSNAAGMIEIVDKLESGAQIGVYHYMDDKAITAGYNTYNADNDATAFFFSNDESKNIKKNGDGELVFDLPPIVSVAFEGDTTEYASLASALTAWVDGSTLTLLRDVETSSTINVPSGTYTLDLNGCGIKKTDGGSVIIINGGGNLTLQDSDPTTTHYFTNENGIAKNINNTEGDNSFKGGYITGGTGTGINGLFWSDGGGIWIRNGNCTMTGGNIIGNTAAFGGGVEVYSGTFTMSGGRVCYCAGGVYQRSGSDQYYISGESSTVANVVITGGEICDNTKHGIGQDYCYGVCNLTISGGSILRNQNWGAVSKNMTISGSPIISQNRYGASFSSLYLSDNPVITDNTERNLWIGNDRKVNIVSGLGETASIGVTMQTPGLFTNSENTDLNDVSKFFSDDEDYRVKKNADGQLMLAPGPVASVTVDNTTTEYDIITEAVAAWVDGSTLTLLRDVEISSAITVPSGTHTLDLNGRGILMTETDKVISVPADATLNIEDNGELEHYITLDNYHATAVSKTGTETIPVEGTGVVKVSGGYIAGGNNSSYYGGGISVEGGILNMSGGTVIGNCCSGAGAGISNDAGTTSLSGNTQVIYNKSTGWGGAIYNGHYDATLSISDNVIVMYNCGKSGIHLCDNPLKLSGSPKILDNTILSGGTGKGIRAEYMLDIVGPLNDAKISVCLNNVGDGEISREGQLTLTSEYIDANTAAQFICENDGESGFTIVRRGQELWVTTGYSVSYLANGGEGTTLDENNPYEKNATATILANAFTAPEGKQFAGWNTEADGTGVSYEAGDMFEVVCNLTLYAQWEIAKYTLTVSANNDELGSVEVNTAGIIDNQDGTYTVEYGTEVTIKATAVEGYHLDSWSNGAEVNEAGTIAVVVVSDTSMVANFAVDKIAITPTVAIEGWKYGDTPKQPTVTGNDGEGEVTYVYARKGSDDFSEEVPTEAGDYVVKVLIGQTDEYAAGEATAEFTIGKADNEAATIVLEGWKYGETPKKPTVTGNGDNGTVTYLYAAKGSDEFSETAPTTAGDYVVKAIIDETANFEATTVTAEFTIEKAIVTVSGVEVATTKLFDNTTEAEVIKQGTLTNLQGSDALEYTVTAAYNDATPGSGKTITLTYTIIGPESLMGNYSLASTTVVYSTDGYIAEPIVVDTEHQASGANTVMRNGFEISLFGYCSGGDYSLQYHLGSGNPDQYKVEFENSRFTDIDWTNLTTAGADGTIEIGIPANLPTGDYSMKVTFRNSHYVAFESDPIEVSFHVNLPETYTRPLFDNVIAVIDTCNCLTDIQWYHRDNSNADWEAISGATGYYYRQVGGLTGEYFISTKMNGVSNYTCPQTDVKTLYGAPASVATVHVSPNPVVNNAQITIEGSENFEHELRIVNIMGNEVEVRTFNGSNATIDMGAYPMGNYMICVDGVVVKVIKK
ncbi:MAG: hypothetical protein E7069_03235 [Bacteroidales bacterium]|nr:hypothetical protein [Bacteroidales bacterium]